MQTRLSLPILALALAASAAPALARPLSDLDRDFLVRTQQTNYAELAAAGYALAHSDSPRIKNYALTIEASHTVALKDVETYAKGAHVDLPTAPSADQVAEQQQLEKLSGGAFDSAYLEHQVEGHKTEISLARQEARYGTSGDVASLARQLVSPLTYHLNLAEQTLASLRNPIQSGELSPARSS